MKSFYDRLTITIHLFYFILIIIFFEKFFKAYFDETLYAPTKFIWLLRWLPSAWFIFFIKTICITGVISLTTCVIFPWNRIFRILSFLCVIFYVAIAGSYLRVIHDFYGCLFSSFVLIFLPDLHHSRDKLHVDPQQVHRASQTLFIAQFIAISCYTLAGLWKLRFLSGMFYENGMREISELMGNTIAYEHLTYSHNLNAIGLFMMNHDEIATFFFLGLVLLQLTSSLIIFFTEFHFYLGMMFFTFHVMSEIILNIPFRPQMYLVVALLVFSPYSKLKFWQKKSLPKEAFDIEQ